MSEPRVVLDSTQGMIQVSPEQDAERSQHPAHVEAELIVAGHRKRESRVLERVEATVQTEHKGSEERCECVLNVVQKKLRGCLTVVFSKDYADPPCT